MQTEQHYIKKVSPAGKVSYQPVVEDTPTVVALSDAQCLTAAGALGLTLLCLFERHFPAHKRVARKIKAVETAITDLYAGNGEAIDTEIADHFCKAWDKTMLEMSA